MEPASTGPRPLSPVGLLAAALSLLAGVTALRPVGSGDTYWHLSLGKATVEAGWFCFPEPVGLSAVPTYCNHYWAWNVPAWLAWEAGGPAALGLLTGVTAGLASWLILRLSAALAGPRAAWTGLALGALAVAGVHHRFVARPQSVFLLMVPMILLLGLRWRRSPVPAPRGLLAGIAALLLYWAHAHASVTIAPLMLASLAFGVALSSDWGLRLEGVTRPRVLAFAGLCALLLLGPKGIGILSMVAEHADSDISEHIGEFQRMPATAWWPPWDTSLALAELLAGLGILGVLRRRRAELGPAALALLGLLLTWNAVRFRAVWSVLALPFAVLGLRPEGDRREAREAATLAVVAVLAAGAAMLVENPRPGLGVDEAVFPVGPAEVLRQAKLQGPVFAGNRAGGYLGWELGPQGVRIPIDGRAPLLFNEEEYFAARRAMADFAVFETLDRRHRFEAAITYKDTNTCVGLSADPRWVPVWTGETFALFAAADGALRGALRPLVGIDPCGSTVARCRQDPTAGPLAWDEAQHLATLTPREAWLPRLQALLALQCPSPGARPSPDEPLRRAAALAPDHPDMPWLRAQARLQTGDAEGALAELALARRHTEADLLTLRLLERLDRPADAAPVARALLERLDDDAPLEARELGGWAFAATGEWAAASRQALRGAFEGSAQSLALVRRLYAEDRIPAALVPVAEGLMSPPRD
jgi:hypothetical protein